MAEAVASPNKPRPADPEIVHVADTLRRIEKNYATEGSGPGSRFEGRLLEDVQAEAVVRMVREADALVVEHYAAQDGEREVFKRRAAAVIAYLIRNRSTP